MNLVVIYMGRNGSEKTAWLSMGCCDCGTKRPNRRSMRLKGWRAHITTKILEIGSRFTYQSLEERLCVIFFLFLFYSLVNIYLQIDFNGFSLCKWKRRATSQTCQKAITDKWQERTYNDGSSGCPPVVWKEEHCPHRFHWNNWVRNSCRLLRDS